MSQTADTIAVQLQVNVTQYNQAMVQVASITNTNMKAAEKAAEKSSSAIGEALKKAGSQLPGMVKGLIDGQSAMQVFLGGVAQVAPAFGPWGIAIGAAAGVLDVLIGSLGSDFEGAAERAKAAQESFNQAVEASRGLYSDAEQGALDLASKLGLVERGFYSLASAEIQQALDDNVKTLKDNLTEAGAISDEIDDKIRDAAEPPLSKTLDDDAWKRSEKFVNEFKPQFSALVEKLKDPNLTGERLGQIALELRKLSEPAKQFDIDLTSIIAGVTALGGKIQAQADKNEYLRGILTRVNEAQAAGARTLRQMGFTIPEATGHVNGLVGALDSYLGRLLSLKSMGGVDIGAPAVKATRGRTIAALMENGALLDGTAEGNERAAREQQALAAARSARDEALGSNPTLSQHVAALFDYSVAYGASMRNQLKQEEGAEAARRRGIVASQKQVAATQQQTAATDQSNQKILQQIDLNERLIAVYRQGEDARERLKALVEAENEAKQRNLTAGTTAYKRFIADRTAAAERLRETNSTLSDYAKGDELTKSVMTTQEQYNAKMNEYNQLRNEGIIKEETYLRLVRELNVQNSVYVESIRAIGDAIQGGIQGATSFGDALGKIGLSLVQLIAQAAFLGQGPLAKLFDGVFGTSGGLFNLTGAITGALGGGAAFNNIGIAGFSAASLALPGRASGGQVLPGQLYEVGEAGREWFAPSVPGQVIPNSVIKAAAGGNGGGPPINFNISMAGANGDRTIAEIAAAAVKKGLASVPEINRQHRIRFA